MSLSKCRAIQMAIETSLLLASVRWLWDRLSSNAVPRLSLLLSRHNATAYWPIHLMQFSAFQRHPDRGVRTRNSRKKNTSCVPVCQVVYRSYQTRKQSHLLKVHPRSLAFKMCVFHAIQGLYLALVSAFHGQRRSEDHNGVSAVPETVQSIRRMLITQ